MSQRSLVPTFSSAFTAVCLSLTLSQPAFGQELVEQPGQSDQPVKKWSASITGGLIQSTVHPEEADFYVGAYSSISGSYQWSEKLYFLAGISANKTLNGYRENQLSSSYIGLSRSLDDVLVALASKGVQSSLGLTLDLPFNKDDVKYDGYLGSLQVSPEASYTIESGIFEGVSLGANASLTRYFHTYTSNKGGYPLAQHAGSVGLSVSKPIFFGAVLSASFSLSRAWDYDEVAFKTRYSASQSISKKLTPHWSVSLGHANRSGYAFDYNGIDPKLTFYDPFNSKVYISTGYSL